MTRIVVRCDSSIEIGSGHVIRCRTLARELQRRGAAVTFLCRRQPGDLISLLEQEFAVLALPEQLSSDCEGLEGRDLYGYWLGCSQEKDAAQCLQALAEYAIKNVSWLIVDHYGLDARWETQLLTGLSGGDIPPQLLVIDDLADRPHKANCLLDQNFFGSVTKSRYTGLVPDYCRQLLGPHYALMAPEYALLHSLVPSRTELKRVLVYFGGVDPMNLTSLSLEVLSDFHFRDLAVDVVIGQLDCNYDSIKKIASFRPNTTIHNCLPSLAGLIARADLSIGAGGSTTWERSCLNLPSIVIPTASNQNQIIKALDEAGYVRQLGIEISADDLKATLLDLGQIYGNSSSKLGNSLTDGLGAQCLAETIID